MFKKVFTTVMVLAFVAGMSNLSFAMMCGTGNEKSSHQKMAQTSTEYKHETGEIVEADNKVCPVSDEEIDEKTKVTYEYEGKIYNFCCKACVKDFKKDPQKYIEKLEAMEEKKANGHEGHHDHHNE